MAYFSQNCNLTDDLVQEKKESVILKCVCIFTYAVNYISKTRTFHFYLFLGLLYNCNQSLSQINLQKKYAH